MKHIVPFILTFVFLSCDDALFNAGETISKDIEIEGFNEIFIGDIFDIYLIQDTVCAIEARGGSNLLPNLEISVDEDKKLRIDNNNKLRWSRKYDRIELFISVDTLTFLQLNEPSHVISQNTLITRELKIYSLGDYGEIDLDLNCDYCLVVNSGTSGGIISLSGETNSLNIWARASLRVNAENFISNIVTVKNESIADCTIHVNNELQVEILNDGNVLYKGNPEIINYINDKARAKLVKL